jgi:hypothetical protein
MSAPKSWPTKARKAVARAIHEKRHTRHDEGGGG